MRRPSRRLFSLIGVVGYLTREAASQTLRFAAARAAAVGEPWLTWFEPEALRAELLRLAFTAIDDLDSLQAQQRYFGGRTDGLRPSRTVHVMRARR